MNAAFEMNELIDIIFKISNDTSISCRDLQIFMNDLQFQIH